MPHRNWLTALVLTVFTAALASAQTQQGSTTAAPPPQPQPQPCVAPEHRQFDFWVGDWKVTGPRGGMAGTNRIESILNGCVIQEHWDGAGGVSGTSFNTYQPSDQSWHQIWVDSQGNLLVLKGGMKDGKMDMVGDSPTGTGGVAQNRVTWEPIGTDKVRQLWTSSTDGGKTWNTVFDGLYSRTKP